MRHYRHTENINIFFQFQDEIGIWDVSRPVSRVRRFELGARSERATLTLSSLFSLPSLLRSLDHLIRLTLTTIVHLPPSLTPSRTIAQVFRFETVDLYEGKNLPKVIFCLHALSKWLYKMGMIDSRVRNLEGLVDFSGEFWFSLDAESWG